MSPCPFCTTENPDSSISCSKCKAALKAELSLPTRWVDPSSTEEYEQQNRAKESARFIPGTMVTDRYRIVCLIGKGGMGEVYRAEDLKLRNTVALKFLPSELDEDPRRLEYLLKEVRLARQISHPNVCRVFDVDEVGGKHFLTMEWIEGEDLRALLRRIGPLPNEKGLEIAIQLCAGLAAAHRGGILHRDLKPANIMLDGSGQIRITDFGLACLISEKNGVENAGTPAYMAPEQISEGKVSVQSDIFSLGLVLFELFTGKRLRNTNSLAELKRQQIEQSHLELPEEIDALDPRIARVIGKCLQPSLKLRALSIDRIVAELPMRSPVQVALDLGETPSPRLVAAEGDQERLDSRKAIACLLGVVLLLLCNLWFSQRAMRTAELMHPERYLDRLRDIDDDGAIPQSLGINESPTEVIYGFENFPNLVQDSYAFWYRERFDSIGFNTSSYWANVAGRISFSRARPDFFIPAQDQPAEVAVILSGQERNLLYFRAIPRNSIEQTDDLFVPAKWNEWFPPKLIGFNLQGENETTSPAVKNQGEGEFIVANGGVQEVNKVTATVMESEAWTPPGPYDDQRVWRVKDSENKTYRVFAAAYRGKPTYFIKLPEGVALPGSDLNVITFSSFSQQASSGLSIFLLLVASVLAYKNIRRGRIDRRGGLRLAMYVFGINCIILACYARHSWNATHEYYDVLVMGLSQGLYTSIKIWLFYMAIEPSVRKISPYVLTTAARLFEGRIRDAMLGRDLLVGVLFGAAIQSIWRLNFEAQSYLFGILPNTGRLNPLALDGALELIGCFFSAHGVALHFGIEATLLLLTARLLFGSQRRAMIGFVFILSFYVSLAFIGGHPVLSLLFSFANCFLIMCVLVRFGVLCLVVCLTVMLLCDSFPLTLNSSAWYFYSSTLAVAAAFAIACVGYYLTWHPSDLNRIPAK